MSLIADRLPKEGETFFRYRSYAPFILLGASLLGIQGLDTSLGIDNTAWNVFCFFVGILGALIRAHAVGFSAEGTSGRNCSHQVADQLNTSGLYSICRNPLYLGNYLMWVSVPMLLESVSVFIIFTLCFMYFYERVIATEEKFLVGKFGDVYVKWASKTPLILPVFWRYKPSKFGFNIRKVMKQEYLGWASLCVSHAVTGITIDYFIRGSFMLGSYWANLLVATAIIFLVMRVLLKTTKLFNY